MNVVEQMKKFMEPKSVALLGIPRQSGEGAPSILENLLEYGYEGKIYPVNPNATEIRGVKTYPRVADIDNEVDLAIINLPRSLVPGVVKECVEKGIQAIIIETMGFADANDDEGKRLQKELDALIKKSGVRIVGPNTYGTGNAFINFSSGFAKFSLAKVPAGVICQAGAFFNGLHELRVQGKGFDLGNACDVDFADAMEYFEQDDEIKVVVLHIEGTRSGKRFIEVANRLARRKPVLALKTGRTEYAAQAIQSHTGSLVGKDEVWEAAFKQAGIIRVDDIEELADLVRAFPVLPLMKGRRIGIATNSGGLGIVCIDACHRFNLEVAKLSPASVKRVSALFPPWLDAKNPLDTVPASAVQKNPFAQVVSEFMGTLLNDDGVDAVLYLWPALASGRLPALCQTLAKLAETHQDKPLVCSFQGRYAEEAKNQLEATGRIIAFQTPERAIRALARISQYSAFRRGL